MQLLYRKFTQILPCIWHNKLCFTFLILFNIYGKIVAELTCHQCHGINCLRTSYNATQKCIDDFDICVTVFNGQTVMAQGCLEQISEELRNKCYIDMETNNQDFKNINECFKCNENLCNNMATETFECIQCDSNIDDNCRFKAESLKATRCLVSRTPNEYCFAKREDERIVRGCLYSLEAQIECLSSDDCMICQASEIKGCNAVVMSVNNCESGGSGNDNGSAGNGTAGSNEGDSPNGSGASGTDDPNNSGSDNKPGGNDSGSSGGNNTGNEGSSSDSGSSGVNNTGNEGSGSGNSGSNNESNGNDNNSSQGGSSDTEGGLNGSSTTITNFYFYILILNICNYYVFARN